MLSSISWNQYFIFLAIATGGWYLFIWVTYFKATIPALAGLVRSHKQEDEPGEIARHIVEELRPVFIDQINKKELILALQQTLQRYSNWNEPGFRDAINEFIALESESVCSIRLSETDLRAVWS